MDFTNVIQQIKNSKYAGYRYEKEGHQKFRDCVTVCRNGKFLFERYCYGEAAGKVCEMTAESASAQGVIAWNYAQSDYSLKTEAPQKLTGEQGEALLFDDKKTPWLVVEQLKQVPQVGLGRLKMLFGG